MPEIMRGSHLQLLKKPIKYIFARQLAYACQNNMRNDTFSCSHLGGWGVFKQSG